MIVALSRAAAFTAALMIVAYGMLFTDSHSAQAWLLMMLAASLLLLYALVPRLSRSVPTVNRTIVVIGAVFVVGFLLLSVQLVRIQIVESADIADRQAVVGDGSVVLNPRKQSQAAEISRGRIVTRDGDLVANTVQQDDGNYERTYPNEHLSSLAGYYSPLVYGSTRLEAQYQEVLMGREGGNPFDEWMNEVLHRTQYGYDLVLSVDSQLQRQAYELLGDRAGAVILMDAETAEVYTMASRPHIDPNRLYAGIGEDREQQIEQAREYWQQVTEDDDSPLVFRPTQGMYAPGSVFKTITAAAALESDIANPQTMFRNEGALTVGSHIIEEQNLPEDDRVDFTLTEAYGYSLNVTFAELGIQLGPQRLTEMARSFGFDEEIPFDLNVNPSRIANDPAYLNDNVGLAETAFGQGQLFATPMQMAMMTQAVANDGDISEPYIVREYRDHEGNTLRTHSPSSWREAVDSDIAEQLQEMMIASVQDGWASGAQIPDAVVGGKTGTAEVAGNEPHAWFVGFAGNDDPRYVVAVVVENGGSGGSVALPIGREMLVQAMDRLD